MRPLTDEERRAIAALRRLAKRWPSSLWLFATGDGIHVMRHGPRGEHVVDAHGSVDQDYKVTTIVGIDNDGGGW